MKKCFFCLILILIIPISTCNLNAAIVFNETIYDFGNISKETTVKHTFIFKNTGKNILFIDRIKAG